MAVAGDCDVIVVGDGDMWGDDYIWLADNETCALNAFECLCASDSPVESSTWGLIKALYR